MILDGPKPDLGATVVLNPLAATTHFNNSNRRLKGRSSPERANVGGYLVGLISQVAIPQGSKKRSPSLKFSTTSLLWRPRIKTDSSKRSPARYTGNRASPVRGRPATVMTWLA